MDAKWKRTINDALTNPVWAHYDPTITGEINDYNSRFADFARLSADRRKGRNHNGSPADYEFIRSRSNSTEARSDIQEGIDQARHYHRMDPVTTLGLAQRYNGGGDPSYAEKLNYALDVMTRVKRPKG